MCWCVCVELNNSEWTQKSTNSVRPKIRQHIQGKGSGVNLAYNPPSIYPFHYHSIEYYWGIFKQIGREVRRNNHKFRKEVFKQFTIVALSVILLSYITKPNKNKKKKKRIIEKKSKVRFTPSENYFSVPTIGTCLLPSAYCYRLQSISQIAFLACLKRFLGSCLERGQPRGNVD